MRKSLLLFGVILLVFLYLIVVLYGKYSIFWITLFLGTPTLVYFGFHYRPIQYFLMFLFVASTTNPKPYSIMLIDRSGYRTITRGLEIGIWDILCVALILIMLIHKAYKIRWLPPLSIPMFLYLTVSLISWSLVGENFPVPVDSKGGEFSALLIPYYVFEINLYPLFEVFQIFKSYFWYWCIYNFIQGQTELKVINAAMVGTTLISSYHGWKARYVMHQYRVAGRYGHPNTYGAFVTMLTSYVSVFAFGMRQFKWNALYGIITSFIFVCVLFSVSRSAVVAVFLCVFYGMFTTTFMGNTRWYSKKNMFILAVTVVVVAVILSIAGNTLSQRFVKNEGTGKSDGGNRDIYKEQALMMGNDHLFGVGMGNFCAYSWHEYGEKVGAHIDTGTSPHNVWVLTFAELGYPGVMAFVILWSSFFIYCAVPLFDKKLTLSTLTFKASFIAIGSLHLNSLFHLVYRETPNFILLFMLLGICMRSRDFVVQSTREDRLKLRESQIAEEQESLSSNKTIIQSQGLARYYAG